MSGRLMPIAFTALTVVGCGSGEEYNTIQPEAIPVVKSQVVSKRPVTKPPAAPKQQRSAPID